MDPLEQSTHAPAHTDRFMGRFIDFEAVETAPVEGGTDEPAAAEPPTPAAVEPVEAAPADPFEGVDLDALRALTEAAPHLLTRLTTPPVQDVRPQQGPPDFDPLDPESVQAYFQWRDEQLLGQIQGMVTPLAERAQQQAVAEQNELLKDAAHDIEVKKGEFIDGDTSRPLMLSRAREIYSEVSQRYGETDRAAEIALERAHAEVADREKRIGEAYHERKMNELKTLSGVRTDPPVRGAAGETVGEYKNEMEAMEAFLARANAA